MCGGWELSSNPLEEPEVLSQLLQDPYLITYFKEKIKNKAT